MEGLNNNSFVPLIRFFPYIYFWETSFFALNPGQSAISAYLVGPPGVCFSFPYTADNERNARDLVEAPRTWPTPNRLSRRTQ